MEKYLIGVVLFPPAMGTIKESILPEKTNRIADYFNLYSKKKMETEKNKFGKKIKIAILPSFTLRGLREILFVKCCSIGIIPEFYESSYNQYSRDILDDNSNMYKFEPDLVVLFIDIMTILGDLYFLPYNLSDDDRKKWLKEKLEEINSLVNKIKTNSSAKILLHNFNVPLISTYGILESKQNFGFIESIEKLNSELRTSFKYDPQVFVFDYNSFCSKIGKQTMMDYKMYYIGDIRFDIQHMPSLCDEYLAYIKPIKSIIRKCIVLDLDNTLWGGVIGEDGIEGINLGQTPEGRPFLEFQKYLLSLHNRGILLAINSKNNFNDVAEVFKKHPCMILKEEHFASMKINWNDKISNMKLIADELNIGMESFVFIDDNKLSREMIRSSFPEVYVIDMPEDTSLYLKTIMELREFDALQITKEDKRKGKMYAEQRKRLHEQKLITSIDDYLKGLNTVVTIEKANPFNIPRISQLTQKTNQFNMTTRRYLEEDIKKFSKSGGFLVACVKVRDKFGDNGITGAVIAEKNLAGWRIDTLLLSCRVIGRKIENVLMQYIINMAKKSKARKLIGEFIPTGKNVPAKNFYESAGFNLVKNEGNKQLWEYDLSKKYQSPDFIKLILEENTE